MLTTVHLFTLRPGRVPAALVRAVVDPRRLRATPGVRFAKVLGTGDGRTFTPRDVDLRRWVVLCVWEDAHPSLAGWESIAEQVWRADLALIHARGRWARREPFGPPCASAADGPVAAITRARLRPLRAGRFWRAVPPVAEALRDQPGLRFSVSTGESPIGLQGTFSLWDRERDLVRFAYRTAAHAEVVRRTPEAGWYAEELFARFAVVRTTGHLDSAA